MLFAKFWNDLNKDTLSILQHKGMEHSKETIEYATVITYTFTQYPLKRGLKELGKKWETAVTEELYQLYMRDKFLPKLAKHLTEEQNQEALESLIFLKVKRDRILKDLTFKDGRKQRKNVVPGDETYPIVSTEYVLITAAIDAHEGRDVGICDIPGAFLSEEMDKDAKMTLCGRLAELILNIVLQMYIHQVIYKKGRPVLYVTLEEVYLHLTEIVISVICTACDR